MFPTILFYLYLYHATTSNVAKAKILNQAMSYKPCSPATLGLTRDNKTDSSYS